MPKPDISVCVLALNEEKNLKRCLESVKILAKEIVVVVDDSSTDRTETIAREYSDRVFIRPHQELFHINKEWAVEQAKNNWILWLDADEKLGPGLAEEIKRTISQPKFAGYQIARKNIIFGKWIKHTGWYPDWQLRLWRKGKVHWPCLSIHEHPEIKTETGKLEHHLIHYNYSSVSQFLTKLNRYTSLDAKALSAEIKPPYLKQVLGRPIDDFVKRFVAWQGYKDGLHGLALSLLQAFYSLVVVLKVWEMNQFPEEKTEGLVKLEKEMKKNLGSWQWWKRELKIKASSNRAKRWWHKSLRKLGL
jgi:glycosyltransferase involved in cell wall biosynthesis